MSSRLQGSATESDSSSIQTKMVRVEGFEPPTASSQTRSAAKLRYTRTEKLKAYWLVVDLPSFFVLIHTLYQQWAKMSRPNYYLPHSSSIHYVLVV